jgi:hypothetical protein
MTRIDVLGTGGLLLAVILSFAQQARPVPPRAVSAGQDVTAVGTFKPQDLVVAYYKSSGFAQKLRGMKAEQEEARRKGDEQKVRELETKGEALQERAHGQYDGNLPITEILDELRPAFPEIAREAGVGAIVGEFVWKSPGFKTVDVTERLIARLPAAEKPAPR